MVYFINHSARILVKTLLYITTLKNQYYMSKTQTFIKCVQQDNQITLFVVKSFICKKGIKLTGIKKNKSIQLHLCPRKREKKKSLRFRETVNT